MKLLLTLLLSFFVSASHAEELFIPLSQFDNDSQRLSKSKVLEFWGYNNYDNNYNYQNILTMRYFNPIEAGNWQGRIRLDTSYASSYNSIVSANNAGQYSAGNTMVTVWGQDRTFLKPLGALIGGRVIFPFGNNGQWAAGPQLNWSFVPQVNSVLGLTDFSPLVRYMYGFDTKNNSLSVNPNQPALIRNLQLFPTFGFQLSPSTMLRFWDENGAIYNSAGGGWFVPIDAMVTHRISKHWVFAVGASKQVVQSYSQYDWSSYAKISYNF